MEERGDSICASREVLTMHREEREEQHFVDERSIRLFESFTAIIHPILG